MNALAQAIFNKLGGDALLVSLVQQTNGQPGFFFDEAPPSAAGSYIVYSFVGGTKQNALDPAGDREVEQIQFTIFDASASSNNNAKIRQRLWTVMDRAILAFTTTSMAIACVRSGQVGPERVHDGYVSTSDYRVSYHDNPSLAALAIDPKSWVVTWKDATGQDVILGESQVQLSAVCPTHETTHSGSSRADEYVVGGYDWNGSFKTYLRADMPIILPGDSLSQLTLRSATGRAFAGSVLVISWDITADADATETTLFVKFQGTSALSIS